MSVSGLVGMMANQQAKGRMTRRGVLGAAASVLVAPSVVRAATPHTRIAFVMNGEPGDVGWNYEHVRGLEAARAFYGDRVEFDLVTHVPEWGAGDADVFVDLVTARYDLIFACSAGYGPSVLQVAVAAPHARFEYCGGYVRADNVSTYSARWYQGRLPEGYLAGHITRSNRIGYLASYPIPQVFRGINAAYLAARAVNPNVTFDIRWLNTWNDPALEAEVAVDLIAQGADVLLADTHSTKPTEVAERLGVFAIGKSSDMATFGPNAALFATVDNWGPYYMRRIQAVLDGTWRSRDTWGGYREDMIRMGSFSPYVPDWVRARARKMIHNMRIDFAAPFEGPLRLQNGRPWLGPGTFASDLDLQRMDFFVEGLTDVPPDVLRPVHG